MKLKMAICMLFLFLACSKQSTERNPYLNEIGFRFDINLNLPLYSPLTTLGNAVYINNAAAGIRGVFVIKVSQDQYRAFEASCPNHAPNECSTMGLNGQQVTCSCEDYTYSLFNGLLTNPPEDGSRYYNLLEYRATFNGSNVVAISN
ncbi:MAG: hypothetical protein AB3N16_12830 [Flavobacteriaceae bacterium]